LVSNEVLFTSHRDQVVALAARHAIPTLYAYQEFAAAGGLMSYGPSRNDGYRLCGVYVARILKGEKPGDMPVRQPTKPSWSSIARPPRLSGSTSRPRCCGAPTR